MRLLHPHWISTFQIHLMDYPDQGFAKLKYSNTSTPIIRKDQSHLDLQTDFASIWWYPVAFRHCIKNLDSPVPKHSELLANHYDDLKSEGHLYPCILWVALDSRTLSRWVTCLVRMYLYISWYVIPVSSYSLVKRTTNPYGTQRPPLDKHHHLIMIYHLAVNIFKNYTINPPLPITNIILKISSEHKSSTRKIQLYDE